MSEGPVYWKGALFQTLVTYESENRRRSDTFPEQADYKKPVRAKGGWNFGATISPDHFYEKEKLVNSCFPGCQSHCCDAELPTKHKTRRVNLFEVII